MRKENKRGRGMLIFICIVVFLISIIIGIVSKLAIQPSWAKKYSVKWSDDVGTLYKDISYDDGEANKFDLYLPRDNSKESYGLVVY